MSIDHKFTKKFGIIFLITLNLSNYSWFNLGGNAEYFFKPKIKPIIKFF